MLPIQQLFDAQARIAPYAVKTPLLRSDHLDKLLGFHLYLKAEPLQRTGSFKFRGAMNAIAGLPDDGVSVLAFSSGNHAQAVALAAKLTGRQATIVMPEDAPKAKIARTKDHGATVILYDRYTESREEIAAAIQKDTGSYLIPPYEDARVIAGQGTIGLEIGAYCKAESIDPDMAIICCGGGGLASGTAIGLKHYVPDVQIYSAEPDGFDDMARSLAAGTILSNDPANRSICDAIVTPQPGNLPFAICKELLAGGKSVSEQEVLQAMKIGLQHFKIMIEPGGAVALAAALKLGKEAKGKNIIAVASGGNVDEAQIVQALQS